MTKEKSGNLITDFKRLGKLWPYLQEHRRWVVTGILLIPLISILTTVLPLVLREAIDEGIGKGNSQVLVQMSLLYLFIVIARYLTSAGQSLSIAIAVNRMIVNLRMQLTRHVLKLKAAYHDRNLSGALTTRATSDFDNLNESLNMGVITPIIDMAVLISCIVGMVALDWRLAIAAIVLLPVVGVVVHWFSRAMRSAMLIARKKIAALNAFAQECLYGHVTIKLLNAEQRLTQKFHKMNEEYRDAQMKSVYLDAFMFSIIDGISSIAVGLVLYVSFAGFLDASGITAGIMVAFVQYIHQLFDPIKQLGNKIAMLQGAFTAIDRIFGVMDTNEYIAGDRDIENLRGHIKFENVSFSYGEEQRILKDFNFELAPGKSLAIVGSTGSGKSTIIKLLTKMYDGYSGDILIDNMNLRHLNPEVLRGQIAIVPQEVVLFDGSLGFNISLGRKGVSQEDVQSAAKAIGAEKFIADLPGGYDFEIKEGGANLSHGQRQIIAFARALCRNPALVVLDEATANIDPESERIIQKATSVLLNGKTVIVIAHRLSTIRQCDSIMVIEKGTLVEQGSHSELMERKSRYFQLTQSSVSSPGHTTQVTIPVG